MIVFYLAYLLMASAISVIYSTGILQNKYLDCCNLDIINIQIKSESKLRSLTATLSKQGRVLGSKNLSPTSPAKTSSCFIWRA